MIRLIAIIILCLGLTGCGGGAHDARLSRIADSLDANPHGALAALDSIDASQLSESDRHYYDLLTVKSRDKAYVTHTSDSLILSVMRYYEHHDTDHYPEALYYGGRVYSDLGDFPTALRYFQDALSVTPDDNLDLLGRLYSQTGRLLNTLRQYRQAIPYIEKSLHLDSIQKDTFNLAYDHQLLGDIYMQMRDYDSAKTYINRAIDYSKTLNQSEQANLLIYRAVIEYRTGNADTAISIIRNQLNKITPDFKWFSLAYASDIYYNKQLYDTAYYYAKEIIKAPDPADRKAGYISLFKPELQKRIPADSVVTYVNGYKTTIELFLKSHDKESTLIQSTRFNYDIHERERLKAESNKRDIIMILYLILFICVLLITILLFIKNHLQKKSIRLQNALLTISDLKAKFAQQELLLLKGTTNSIESLSNHESSERMELLRSDLLNIPEDYINNRVISPIILDSQAYNQIQQFIIERRPIPSNNELWPEIKRIIAQVSPNFDRTIRQLSSKSISIEEMQLMYLIKFGIRPKDLSILFAKEKGSISSQRERLSIKLFKVKVGNKRFDAIIRSI